MRLNDDHRGTFVAQAMQDVPRHPYEDDMQKLVSACAMSKLPAPLRKVMEADPTLQAYLYRTTMWFHQANTYFYCIDAVQPEVRNDLKLEAALKPLTDARIQQERTHRELKRELQRVAKACTTRAQLALALPDFAKYLPPEPSKLDRSVPVVDTTPITKAFKAAGWPKKGKA